MISNPIKHSTKQKRIKQFTFFLRDALFLCILCTITSKVISNLIIFTYDFSEPPTVSQVNNKLFRERCLEHHVDARNGDEWYQIQELPDNLVDSWRFDDEIAQIRLNSNSQVDINELRSNLYKTNHKKAERYADKVTIYIWILGIVFFIFIKMFNPFKE